MAPAHGSPRLFAVFHVLLRRLTPRHPPYALSSFLHVMRRNCISTLPRLTRFASRQARYAVGKVLVTSSCSRPGRPSLPFFGCGSSAAIAQRCGRMTSAPSLGSQTHGLGRHHSRLFWSMLTGKTARHIAGLLEGQPLRSVAVGLFSSGGSSRRQVLVYPATIKILSDSPLIQKQTLATEE
jgi:hypothetical protein